MNEERAIFATTAVATVVVVVLLLTKIDNIKTGWVWLRTVVYKFNDNRLWAERRDVKVRLVDGVRLEREELDEHLAARVNAAENTRARDVVGIDAELLLDAGTVIETPDVILALLEVALTLVLGVVHERPDLNKRRRKTNNDHQHNEMLVYRWHAAFNVLGIALHLLNAVHEAEIESLQHPELVALLVDELVVLDLFGNGGRWW